MKKKQQNITRWVVAAALCLVAALPVQAQVTMSSMSGHVTGAEGALAGATVVATHLPTGTRVGAIADARGDWRLA